MPENFWKFFWKISNPSKADYELLLKLFACEHASSRLNHWKTALEESHIRRDYGIDVEARKVLSDKWKEGDYGMGNGPYHKTHRLLRTKWSQVGWQIFEDFFPIF